MEAQAKVFDIFIDIDLNFSNQIKEICAKATFQPHAIPRIIRYLYGKIQNEFAQCV